ncbi:putative membrane protein [Streptomyces sp. yr375]|uniref:PH domain-containing protein n=1 Tax=Streptomyces sp. yr375 TaxID=1761906 RepID=UPI0008B95875|nr:PH domain-containing protein [Streptomyces sp. yr375]SES18345.1 putative membrane protein [Streptomyces sp. yr375]
MTTPGVEDGVPPELPVTKATGATTAAEVTGAGEASGLTERRLHPVTPFRRAWAPIAVLAGWAVHDPDQAQAQLTRLTTTTLLIALAVLVPAASLYGFLTWWFTHFAVTDSELRIRTGLLFKRTAHIRLERIQAIDVSQPLLARVAGVAKLRLDVVGAEKKDELAFLGAEEARVLRAELLARAAGFAPETAHEVGEAPARELLRVPARKLAIALALTGATWGALAAALVVPPVLWLTTHSVWTVLATGVPLLGAAGASSVGRFVGEYDWTVGESPDGLRIDHGLLDRTHETVPPGRVQTVRIVRPLLWRRLGWVRVELDVAGSANSVLVPVAPREAAEAVIARVLPGVSVPAEASLSRPPRRAGRCVPVWWRGYGIAVTDTVFAARHGLLRRHLTLVPHAKVQSVRLRQGPWQRLWGLAEVHVDTGADKTVTARLRDAQEAAELLLGQAERSRTGRRDARPDRWMA